MRLFLSIIIICVISASIQAQITIDASTLPDAGDELEYSNFNDYEGQATYNDVGADLSWSFDDFNISNTSFENYMDIEGTEFADTFPNADLLVDLGFFTGAAIKTDNTLEVIGISLGDFTGFGIEAIRNFEDSYVLRQTPFTYGDKYEDDFEFEITFDAALVPGIDSVEIPVPGATLDSIRVTIGIEKSEEATAWGTLYLLGNDYDVLKVEQIDNTTFLFEVGVSILGNILWLDASEFIGDFGLPTDQSIITQKFLTANEKRSLVEFRENTFTDSLGVEINNITGRLSADIISDVADLHQNVFDATIYPNPTSEYLNIELLNHNLNNVQLSIRNSKGQLLKTESIQSGTHQLNVQDLPLGHYLIQIKSGQLQEVQAFQILR